ncbi:MAG: ChbG/HpnK family deacetylase [Pseudomonadota bacterium]
MKHLIVCADDFGLNGPVNEGVLALLQKKRLNAVSCMMVGDAIEHGAVELLKMREEVSMPFQTGLHLTFTEYAPLEPISTVAPDGQFPSVGSLLLKSHLARIDREEVKQEVMRQLDRFQEVFGHKPDFLDGHQHVHVLPIFREIVVELSKSRLAERGWVRSCRQPLASILGNRISIMRTALISRLSTGLRKSLVSNDIRTNDLFLGVNDFTAGQGFGDQMRKWLNRTADFDGKTVIMCHPATEPEHASSIHDPIAAHRPHELSYLLSDQFLSDLNNAELLLEDR